MGIYILTLEMVFHCLPQYENTCVCRLLRNMRSFQLVYSQISLIQHGKMNYLSYYYLFSILNRLTRKRYRSPLMNYHRPTENCTCRKRRLTQMLQWRTEWSAPWLLCTWSFGHSNSRFAEIPCNIGCGIWYVRLPYPLLYKSASDT